MRKLAISLAAGIAVFSASSVVASDLDENCEAADLIVHNATIYTGNEVGDVVDSIAVKGGRIVAVGDIASFDCGAAGRLDLGGGFVYPGFTDSHVHLKETGYRELTLDLQNARSMRDMLEMVRVRAAGLAPGQWLEGVGWIEKYWPEGRFPSASDVDKVIADRPVVLRRSDGHSILVNGVALELAGIDANTPDPEGGIIQRDASGKPTGMLIDGAMTLINRLMPPKTDVEDKEALRLALAHNARLGWTGVQNMGGDQREVGLIGELEAEGELKHRVYYAFDDPASIRWLIANGPVVDPDNLVSVRAVKLFADGALGSRGAALMEKYSDDDSAGLMLLTHDEVLPLLEGALRSGIQVATHGIGDRANKQILDWYEEAFSKVPLRDRSIQAPRWRIEHVQVILPEDRQRLKDLRVIPSMEASHAIGDMYFAPTRLGPERVRNAYVWRGMIDLGLIIAGGSDAPVEVGDPRIEFYAAIVRKDLNGYSNEDWHVEQAVSRDVALKMLTIWPAYAAFQERDRGTIEVGKLADLTVFDKDLMTVPAPDILTANVTMTMVGGRIVYSKDEETLK